MKIPEYKYGDLEDKEKADLEKIKLLFEISQIQNSSKEKWEARRFMQETVRILLILLITILGNLWVSSILLEKNSNETYAKILYEKYHDYVQEYITTDDFESKDEIGCRIMDIVIVADSVDNFLKKSLLFGTKDYIQSCEKHNNRQAIAQNENAVSEDTKASLVNAEREANIENQQKRGQTDTQENLINTIRGSEAIEEIKQANQTVATLSEKTERITEIIVEQLKEEDSKQALSKGTSNFISKKTSDVRWFKEGFYLQFQNNIQIYLDKGGLLKDEGSILVRVCDTTSINNCKNNVKVSLNGQGGEFEFGNKNYKINLRAIDRAGKNPFNWAAYITLDEWDK